MAKIYRIYFFVQLEKVNRFKDQILEKTHHLSLQAVIRYHLQRNGFLPSQE